MPEITEDQLAVFHKATAFLQEAATNSATKRDFERLVKKIRPDVETAEDIAAEVAKPYVEKLEAATKRLDDYMAAQDERSRSQSTAESDAARDAAFNRLKAEGYTLEGLDNIKRLMVDRSIADPEAAAALFDRMNPKPAAGGASWEPANWDIRNDAVDNDVAGLFANEDLWADKMVGTVLNEIRLGNRA